MVIAAGTEHAQIRVADGSPTAVCCMAFDQPDFSSWQRNVGCVVELEGFREGDHLAVPFNVGPLRAGQYVTCWAYRHDGPSIATSTWSNWGEVR